MNFSYFHQKWMSEDFRQERKWKITAAATLARAVVEWHNIVDKTLISIKYKKPKKKIPLIVAR